MSFVPTSLFPLTGLTLASTATLQPKKQRTGTPVDDRFFWQDCTNYE